MAFALLQVYLVDELVSHPQWNLDGVFYAALSKETLGTSRAVAHAQTYAELNEYAARRGVRAVQGASGYRKRLRKELKVFEAQLPFFRNKPAYVWSVAALDRLGMPTWSALRWISILAYVGLGSLAFAGLTRHLGPWLGLLAAASFSVTYSVREVGGILSPDALSGFVVAGSLLLMRRHHPWLGVAVACSSVLFRPDNVIVATLAVMAVVVARNQTWRTPALVVGLVPAAIYSAAQLAYPGYGWATLVLHTFGRRIVFPANHSIELDLPTYLGYLESGLRDANVLHPAATGAFLVLAVIAIASTPGYPRQVVRNSGLLIAVWVSVLLHFLAFPLLADRFFCGVYVFTVIEAARMISMREAIAATA